MMQKKEFTIELGGKTLTAEFNDLADQANGSVMLRYGNTVLLATAVMSKGEKMGDYFPLTVDYEERFYATGKILGSRFMRREGRPTEEAILAGRIVDRTIRPLFDGRMRYDVQVVITVLAIDQDDPDVLGIVAASLALGTSSIPWNGPVSAVRLGKVTEDGATIVNPTYDVRTKEKPLAVDILACGKDGMINMIEVGAYEAKEATLITGLEEASKEIEKLQTWQAGIIAEIGKPKIEFKAHETPSSIKNLFEEKIAKRLSEYVFGQAGNARIYELKGEWKAFAKEAFPEEKESFSDDLFEEKVNDLIHNEAIDNDKRPDGRPMDKLRPLFAKAGGISPVIHGTGIFYRGGTHVFSALTLGGPQDAQIIDSMENPDTTKRFMHHYNFPPYSSGETGRIGSTNRRMIGHGALAEKALTPVIPPKDKFPYTIRLVSESLASNGSTSMGSVCGSTLALMDGGVPISAPVAGIASGLMMRNEKEYKVLTDIQGPEDHHGDMDFKVAGTKNGVTAVQMDVKVGGIPLAIFPEAFEKAKQARLEILEVITKEIATPRDDISARAPKIITLKVKKEQIGLVIGGGGKTINGIKEKTGVDEIDIEEDGTIFITGKDGSAEKAAKMIEDLTHEFKPGDRLTGTVVKIAEFGAFVALNDNTDGMVHVSEIAPFRIDRVDTVLKVGDKVPVLVKEIDVERGRIKLSIKDADPTFIKKPTV
ncbi:MAG: polyribonucleotide nucleotidyltransferase [Candidatus Taylorbacteria bacterium CG11_big_fil_rev_8_21_14_0_20_46_11]|uniref:Polyribonucleotide nucleotidyltransferase n=1 Tax=Candidatus Taylorbacteria bacterium CG11_big_fil_rev_8_21_14_0_20_46_11 TaxID=1975025 RepID=A0A2H0KD15_9BACT|nr:MAG: polyribonucleotide nucleotidyltransferase [Candidatus Taylorbacteria bacterium CG11_big_fil_rev_8_21_14_0_20_46_11]